MPRSNRKNIGLPPGSIIYTGDNNAEKNLLHHIRYNAEHCNHKDLINHNTFVIAEDHNYVDWYDLRGLSNTKLIEKIGTAFQIHNLVLEDIVDVHQRPKFEEFEDGILIILKAVKFENGKVKFEHISIYFKEGILLSFQEYQDDVFKGIRNRIETSKGKIRTRKTDYLAYALCDFLVDHQYITIEKIEEEIEKLELSLLDKPESNIREDIFSLKRQVIILRKQIVPLREAINRFSKSDHNLIQDNSLLFLMDLYDHTIHITDLVDSHRDILNGLQDLYLSEISYKMNQIMKVLTIITTVFVPLSFLTSLYGMNFENMPELHFKNGYFILLFVMASICTGLLLWFKKSKWL